MLDEYLEIRDEAMEAFFQVVADHYDLPTGDISPDVYAVFERICDKVISHYVKTNIKKRN